MRNVVHGTPAVEEPVAPGTYVDLRLNDQMVVPAATPFAVQTGQHVAALAALIAFSRRAVCGCLAVDQIVGVRIPAP